MFLNVLLRLDQMLLHHWQRAHIYFISETSFKDSLQLHYCNVMLPYCLWQQHCLFILCNSLFPVTAIKPAFLYHLLVSLSF